MSPLHLQRSVAAIASAFALLTPTCFAANPKPKAAIALPASPTRVYSIVSTGSLRQVRAVYSSFLYEAFVTVAWESTDLLACGPPIATGGGAQVSAADPACQRNAIGVPFYSDGEPYCGPCTQPGQDPQC